MKQSSHHWRESQEKKEEKKKVGWGRKKQETDTEDKTGKKVMICLIAKKLQ